MKKPELERTPIDDAEFFRLHRLYLERRDPMRRSPERAEIPVDIKPSVSGARIVNWKEYQELVAKGEANYPPQSYGVKK